MTADATGDGTSIDCSVSPTLISTAGTTKTVSAHVAVDDVVTAMGHVDPEITDGEIAASELGVSSGRFLSGNGRPRIAEGCGLRLTAGL